MNDLKIGAAYVRVSTEDQTEYSPDSQLKLIRDYAKREGYIIPDEYIFRDEGISGKSADKRPAFRLMIATAKEDNRPFDAIFVWKYSRFARNQEEAIMYKNLLRKKGVEVKSISEPSNDSPFSSLIERIIEWMDEYYLINLAGEVKRGMKEKVSRGEPTGRCAFGYKVENKMLVKTDDASIVRTIFEWYANGKSILKIATDLNDAGLKKNGKAFGKESIRYILKNPVYIGKIRWSEDDIRYGSGAYVPDIESLQDGNHTAIISRELWDAAQARMNKRGNDIKYVRQNHRVTMLKGLIRCSACGSTLTEVNKGKDRELGLQCCGYTRGSCGVSHYIKLETAKEAVIDGLEQVIASKTFLFTARKPSKQRADIDWDKLIVQEEMRLKRAKEAYLDGVYSLGEYKEAKATVEDNITKLKSSKEKETPEDIIDTTAYEEKAIKVLSIIKSPDVSNESKNKALRSVIDEIIYNKPLRTFDIYFAP